MHHCDIQIWFSLTISISFKKFSVAKDIPDFLFIFSNPTRLHIAKINESPTKILTINLNGNFLVQLPMNEWYHRPTWFYTFRLPRPRRISRQLGTLQVAKTVLRRLDLWNLWIDWKIGYLKKGLLVDQSIYFTVSTEKTFFMTLVENYWNSNVREDTIIKN